MFSLIVVDYNTISVTISYIKKFLKAINPEIFLHIIIIQNGDKNKDIELLTNCFGQNKNYSEKIAEKEVYFFQNDKCSICYCHSGENLGYARGNNLGAKIAKKIWNDPYLIISNNDLEIDCINLNLIEDIFISNEDVGVIGPQVITPSGIQQSPQKWSSAYKRLIVYYWLRWVAAFLPAKKKSQFLVKHCNDIVKNASSGKCDWISGCFMFIRSKAFFEIDMFDEYTFLYGEEMILSRRMKKKGYAVYFCNEQIVIHNHAQTTKKTISIMESRELDFNAMMYYYKTYCNTSPIILRLAQINFNIYKFFFINIKR